MGPGEGGLLLILEPTVSMSQALLTFGVSLLVCLDALGKEAMSLNNS